MLPLFFIFPAKINEVAFDEDQDDNITFDDFDGEDEEIDDVSADYSGGGGGGELVSDYLFMFINKYGTYLNGTSVRFTKIALLTFVYRSINNIKNINYES